MKNVTITLDEETARWARVWAAEHNTSVSRMLGNLLRQRMEADRSYERAQRGYLGTKPLHLKEVGVSYPDRERVHDR